MDQTPKWIQRYGVDPSMDWSRYAAVDPQKVDTEAFGAKNAPGTTK